MENALDKCKSADKIKKIWKARKFDDLSMVYIDYINNRLDDTIPEWVLEIDQDNPVLPNPEDMFKDEFEIIDIRSRLAEYGNKRFGSLTVAELKGIIGLILDGDQPDITMAELGKLTDD